MARPNSSAETFLPWDLDALFVSTMVLILTKFVDLSLMNNDTLSLEKAYAYLETMIASGNRIAAFRLIELRKLDEMLVEYTLNQQRQQSTTSPATSGPVPSMQRTLSFPDGYHSTADLLNSEDLPPPYAGLSDAGSGFGDDLTAEQILAVAESMDIEGTDWLSFGALDNNFSMVDPSM
jgi:proline utilization trans-activator